MIINIDKLMLVSYYLLIVLLCHICIFLLSFLDPI